eukprot:3588253-Pyramimonas_sp.AAC.2
MVSSRSQVRLPRASELTQAWAALVLDQAAVKLDIEAPSEFAMKEVRRWLHSAGSRSFREIVKSDTRRGLCGREPRGVKWTIRG